MKDRHIRSKRVSPVRSITPLVSRQPADRWANGVRRSRWEHGAPEGKLTKVALFSLGRYSFVRYRTVSLTEESPGLTDGGLKVGVRIWLSCALLSRALN